MLGADINLALSELLTNIVRHAYDSCEDGQILLKARFADPFLEILLVDHGKKLPASVLKKSSIEFDQDDLLRLPEGGFGWPIVHATIPEINYQRVDGCNRLLLRKNIYINTDE